jgi:hypothetical protein
VVVKEENDEDAQSKNWKDNEVYTLIEIRGKMEEEFLKNERNKVNP